jgi:hypothetical protein
MGSTSEASKQTTADRLLDAPLGSRIRGSRSGRSDLIRRLGAKGCQQVRHRDLNWVSIDWLHCWAAAVGAQGAKA